MNYIIIAFLLFISLLTGLNTYRLYLQSVEKKVPSTTVVERVKPKPGQETFKISIPATVDFALTLLKEGFSISYLNGKVYLETTERTKIEKILSDYQKFKKQQQKEENIKSVVAVLIKNHVQRIEQDYNDSLSEYTKLKTLLQSRGVKIDFTPFRDLILELQKEIFNSYIQYWDKKLQQLREGFNIFVETPQVSYKELLNRARNYYHNTFIVNLFENYLRVKVDEAILEADLYKLKEFKGKENY
jgi:hypothetical protein